MSRGAKFMAVALAAVLCLWSASGFAAEGKKKGKGKKAQSAQQTEIPRKAEGPANAGTGGWETLFDGKDLSQWTCKPDGWKAENGEMVWAEKAGYIWTKEQYGNFSLDLEFKLGAKTNSGVFVRTADPKNPVQTGIEIQLLDTAGKQGPPTPEDCGSLYNCLAPSKNTMKKAGEWNRMVITAKDNVIQVDLNGERILDADLDKWTEAHKNPDGTKNKFNTAMKDMPRKGCIGLQDHGKPIWFRNIKIKPLG